MLTTKLSKYIKYFDNVLFYFNLQLFITQCEEQIQPKDYIIFA